MWPLCHMSFTMSLCLSWMKSLKIHCSTNKGSGYLPIKCLKDALQLLVYISYLPQSPPTELELFSIHDAARGSLTPWVRLVPTLRSEHQCHGGSLLAPTKLPALGPEVELLWALQMCLAPKRLSEGPGDSEYPPAGPHPALHPVPPWGSINSLGMFLRTE